jgi:iron complex outermembrane receptor protein
VSAEYPVSGLNGAIYDDLLVSRKDSTNTPNFRPPGTSPLYPNGYLPKVNPIIWDAGNTIGARGALPGGIQADLSNTFGYSDAQFTVRDTSNPALGSSSPTQFDAGTARYWQDVSNLTFTSALPELLSGANLAAGLEYRYERYSLGAGEPSSSYGTGSDGFPGFNPRIPADDGRSAQAAFVDVEVKPIRSISIDAAGRYDHYVDFG